MARKSLSRTTAEALGPIVVPLVTKVALPLAIESMKRGGKFDSDRFLEEAKESLARGVKKSRGDREELKDQLSERGSELYDEVRKQGAEFLETLAERGSAFADEWMGRKPRRRFGLGKALVLLALVGAGIAIFSNVRD
ncbi:MAG TPA: hypothetical protein VGH97_08015 [Thermoanaerobaculia bacterium]|jgi:hypothetical protein